MSGWIGVDLDGTLAMHDGHRGIHHIGAPVPAMVRRVQGWLADGIEVRIVTARVSKQDQAHEAALVIQGWLMEHVGEILPITCCKDYDMWELWDDRAVQVVKNTGERV